MSVDNTRNLMKKYFEALQTGSFAEFFADDVTWTIIDSGHTTSGPAAVVQAVTALHARMIDMQTHHLAVADGSAYLEGDCLRAGGGPDRIAYCVAYDIVADRIAAMRAYGPLPR
jgi:ketosteroid isomerase-like protein